MKHKMLCISAASLLLAGAVVSQEAHVKGVIEPPQPSAAVSVLHGITAAVKGAIVREARGAEDYGQGSSLGGSRGSVSAGVGGKAHSEGGYSGKHIVPGDPVKWSTSKNYPPDTGFTPNNTAAGQQGAGGCQGGGCGNGSGVGGPM